MLEPTSGWVSGNSESSWGLKGSMSLELERGVRHPSELLILSICGTFTVNRSWLEKGKGDMHDSKLAKWTGTMGRPLMEQQETQIILSAVVEILEEGNQAKIEAIKALLHALSPTKHTP